MLPILLQMLLHKLEATARKATADTAQAVEHAAADVKRKSSTLSYIQY